MSASTANGRTLGDALTILVLPPPTSSSAGVSSANTKKREQYDEPSEAIADLLPVVLPKKRKFVRAFIPKGDLQNDSAEYSVPTDRKESAEKESDLSEKKFSDQSAGKEESKGKSSLELSEGKGDASSDPNRVSTDKATTMRERLMVRLESLKEDNQRILRRRQEALVRHRDFLGLYEFALDRISRLNDLRDAPDAILPGNFPDSY
mmetsp:Transcript_48871/g.147254  ORF Transcript_48871/g.147254 Transcript_48871/m.147254 type:complete len:206 (-) Transcript_48871:224-841(-)